MSHYSKYNHMHVTFLESHYSTKRLFRNQHTREEASKRKLMRRPSINPAALTPAQQEQWVTVGVSPR